MSGVRVQCDGPIYSASRANAESTRENYRLETCPACPLYPSRQEYIHKDLDPVCADILKASSVEGLLCDTSRAESTGPPPKSLRRGYWTSFQHCIDSNTPQPPSSE